MDNLKTYYMAVVNTQGDFEILGDFNDTNDTDAIEWTEAYVLKYFYQYENDWYCLDENKNVIS